MSRRPEPTRQPKERVFVCGVLFPDDEQEHEGPLSEARALVEAAGAVVVNAADPPMIQRRTRADASTLMGRGKVEEIGAELQRFAVDAVLVDNDLTPAQVRNLEKAWKKRVIDRSELILDIFAARARTAQSRLQVELAQMEYLRPRLRRMWPHLERLEGAIGTRGPGETQLETDRRLIARRIQDLKLRLAGIEAHTRRQVGSRSDRFTVGLLGYTNAGKSTLLNRLTGAQEFVADMPFATLDTRTRQWKLSDGRIVLLSDTVGFIRKLPHHLIASFHATLEEALNVDVILHVVDAAHPDAASQMRAVEQAISGLTLREPDVLVLNKVDRVAEPLRLHLLREGRTQEVVHVSALTGEGLERLDQRIRERLDARSSQVEVVLDVADGRNAATVRAAGILLHEELRADRELVLRVRVLDGALGNMARALGPGIDVRVIEPAAEPLVHPGPAAPAADGRG
jgi:GTP-binding protein HflX